MFWVRSSMKLENRYNILWNCAFVLYIISFFVKDIAFSSDSLQMYIIRIIRYISYCLFVIYFLFIENIKYKKIVVCILGIAFTLICSLFTGDIYYPTLLFVIISANKIEPRKILKISFITILIMTLFVVVGSFVHIFPMINSHRKDSVTARLGFGFYHSNVLPLIVYYLFIYQMLLINKKYHFLCMTFWTIVSIVVYHFCDSRNGFFAVLLSVVSYCILYKKNRINKYLSFFAKTSIIIFSLLSIIIMLLQGTNTELASLLDRLMSSRLNIAYEQYLKMGIHLVSTMDSNTYLSQSLAIDNGYLYISMRFGIVYLLFYWLIHIKVVKKYNDKPLVLILLIVVSLSNFIDNDFLSYGYLPVVLLAFNSNSLYKNISFPIQNNAEKVNLVI